MKYYDTAVFGATFLGLGAALALENAVVIERGGAFGAEFVNSYKVCEPGPVKTGTESGSRFLEDLKQRGLVSEQGDFYTAPAVYVISSYLEEKPLDILLMTEVTEIQRVGDAYHITVYHGKGFEKIAVKRLLDTTALGIGHKSGKAFLGGRSLNAVLYNPEGKEMEGLTYNPQNGLYVYALPVGENMSRQDAVETLCSMEAQFAEKHMKIVSIGSEFVCSMQPCHKEIAENFVWNPSAAYANPAEAFDQGVRIAESAQTEESVRIAGRAQSAESVQIAEGVRK